MRLKEDSTSWKAGGIKRRDFRHDFGTPEVPTGHPKRKRKTIKPRAPRCKHVWVEVSYREFCRYSSGWTWPSWLYRSQDSYDQEGFAYTSYFVCAGCLQTKTKVDVGGRRAHYRKQLRRSRTERQAVLRHA